MGEEADCTGCGGLCKAYIDIKIFRWSINRRLLRTNRGDDRGVTFKRTHPSSQMDLFFVRDSLVVVVGGRRGGGEMGQQKQQQQETRTLYRKRGFSAMHLIEP